MQQHILLLSLISLVCINSLLLHKILHCRVVESVHTLADTPARLAGAEYETGKWIWVDHKAGLFCPLPNRSVEVRSLPRQPEHSVKATGCPDAEIGRQARLRI